MNDLRLGLHGVALVEGGEAHDGALALRDLVDVLGAHPRLDHQFVGLGHDAHDRVARADDAADGVHVQFVDEACQGGAQVGARQLGLGFMPALAELGDAALRLAQGLQRRRYAPRR
jgi:hypothetical protein